MTSKLKKLQAVNRDRYDKKNVDNEIKIKKVLREVSNNFRIDKNELLNNYISIEHKIYKAALFKILVNNGVSKNYIGKIFYPNSSNSYRHTLGSVPHILKTYDKLVQAPGNNEIKEFVNNYKL